MASHVIRPLEVSKLVPASAGDGEYYSYYSGLSWVRSHLEAACITNNVLCIIIIINNNIKLMTQHVSAKLN